MEKKKRKCFVSNLRKLERKFYHTNKMHSYQLITCWYTLTFKLSIQFMRHTPLVIFVDILWWRVEVANSAAKFGQPADYP